MIQCRSDHDPVQEHQPSRQLHSPRGHMTNPQARLLTHGPSGRIQDACTEDKPSMQAHIHFQTPAHLPRAASNPGSAVKTSLAGKSKTSCLNWSWQLMRDSGRRVSMISFWAGEHSPREEVSGHGPAGCHT